MVKNAVDKLNFKFLNFSLISWKYFNFSKGRIFNATLNLITQSKQTDMLSLYGNSNDNFMDFVICNIREYFRNQ